MADIEISGLPAGTPTGAAIIPFVEGGATKRSTLTQMLAIGLAAGQAVHAVGAVGAPGVSFTGSLTSGLWAPAAGVIALSAEGVEAARVLATGGANPQLQVPAGLATKPSLKVSATEESGLYLIGAANLGVTVAGSVRWGFGGWSLNGASTASNAIQNGYGAVGTPSYTFISDIDTGMWRSAANTLDLAAGGSNILSMNPNGTGVGPTLLITNGVTSLTASTAIVQRVARLSVTLNQTSTAGASLLQLDATNTALGSGAQYFVDCQVAGTTVAGITNGTTSSTYGRFMAGGGASATPGLSFIGTTTGFYAVTSAVIGLVLTSSEKWRWNGSGYISQQTDGYIQQGNANNQLRFAGNISTAVLPSFLFDSIVAFSATTAIVQRHISLTSTINQVSAAGAGFSALQIDLTNTSLDTGAQYFVDLKVAGTTVMAIANGSTAALRGRVLAGGGANASPSLSFFSDPDTGIWSQADNQMCFVVGGTSQWVMHGATNSIQAGSTASSNIRNGSGNGTTVPSYTFQGDSDTGFGQSATSGAEDLVFIATAVARWKATTTTIEPITDLAIALGTAAKRFEMAYVPATGAHWVDADPTTIRAAIDRLAKHIATGGGTNPIVA